MDIPYNDQAITYSGRWEHHQSAARSSWQGSQVRFSVSGSKTVTLRLQVEDETQTGITAVVANIDGGEQAPYSATTAAETFSGQKDVVFSLPSSGAHSIVLKLIGAPVDQWPGRVSIGLKSISLEEGGSVKSSEEPFRQRIEFIGDSWMSAQNDWPYLLSRYSVSPVSFGGATIDMLNSQYLFNGEGKTVSKIESVGTVVIGAGVNDFNRKVPIESYRQSMLSLIYKVRHVHPGARILLLQAPANPSGLNFGMYGPAMESIAKDNGDVVYVPSPKFAPGALQWRPDGLHLTYEGLKVYAPVMQLAIDKALYEKSTSRPK